MIPIRSTGNILIYLLILSDSHFAFQAPLHHPNLVNLLGGCWADGPDKLCLVLELCLLGSLLDLLEDTATEHSFEKTTDGKRKTYYDITMGIVDCFVYLHHEQIGDPLIHRDLKPANVLVAGHDQSDFVAKVADFGESRRFDAKEAEERAKNGESEALTMVSLSRDRTR